MLKKLHTIQDVLQRASNLIINKEEMKVLSWNHEPPKASSKNATSESQPKKASSNDRYVDH